MMAIKSDLVIKEDAGAGVYPEDEELQKFIDRRNRRGWIWYVLFIAATVVAIVALSALLYTIVRDSFGYIVVQNSVDPETLVLEAERAWMLDAANTMSSEDDNELVAGIENNPYAIGFFGYAYYADNQDKLRVISVNGAPPSAETSRSGE